VQPLVQRLLQSSDTLLEQIRSAPSLEFVTSKIRVHGDYHLGQLLWCEEDYYIFDFEGEPSRSLAERRQKESPLKDVAGMVRSYGYAAYAALFRHAASRPDELTRLEPWARLWQLTAASAFLRAYFDAVAGAMFVPVVDAQRDALLQLFILDKALYELNYELNNRPEWVRIPLRSIVDFVSPPA
jgi:maltose alpha-D-glucosyltransferase/alpha-amylase